MKRRRIRLVLAVITVTAMVTAPAVAAPERIIDIVQVTWPGAAAPVATSTDLANVVRTDTIDRWRRISNGSVIFSLGTTYPTLSVANALPCDGYGSLIFMSSVRASVYERAGITNSANRFLLILTPKPAVDCIWDGRGTTNSVPSTSGIVLLKNTVDAFVVAHELGHNLGLGHSNLERCSNGKRDDVWTNCRAIEYGSATDVMSNNDRSSTLAAYHLWRLGIIPNTDVVESQQSQTVVLRPVSDTSGTRAVFIRDNSAAYWVEYRAADPTYDISAGLVIYRTDPPPGSSVQSPFDSDTTDPANGNVTLDIWMIDLGDYVYSPPRSSGSPSLPAGVAFTTAFGGSTLSATTGADGSAIVQIRRNNDRTAPAVPELTPTSSWTTPTSELVDRTYVDRETDLARFDARVSDATGDRVIALSTAPLSDWTPTYLNPLRAPVNVRRSALPEGRYRVALRAVDTSGNTSGWSATVPVTIDLGRPEITPALAVSVNNTNVGRTATVRWTGVRDRGSGVCSVRTVNEDGFARLRWSSDRPGVPVLAVAANDAFTAPAQVFDCLGNGVAGNLRVSTSLIPASSWQRTGRWEQRGDASVCRGSCTATVKTTSAGALLVRQGTGAVYSGDRLLARINTTTDTKVRIPLQIKGNQRIRIVARDLAIVGVQQAELTWTASGTIDRRPLVQDESLDDATQRDLARFGLSQTDFTDDVTVLPMNNGTTLRDPSIDWCEGTFPSERDRVSRRQVVAQARATEQPYVFLSSETVRYRSTDAVRQALAELDTADRSCRQRGGSVGTTGVLTPYVYQALPDLPSGLRPDADRRIYLATSGTGTAALSMLVIYQFKGTLMNNLYVIKRGTNPLTPADVERWLGVAAQLAARM